MAVLVLPEAAMGDLDQLRRNVRVMDLLTGSVTAWTLGDRKKAERLVREALECDATAVRVTQGGMLTGEVPRPEEDPVAWHEYVESAREKLARAEAGEDGDG
jgi:hypothetical protein